MSEQSSTRRLSAILAIDMVGYSRLVEASEEATLARHKAHRKELIDPKIAEHHGRIVKSTGDGLLVEFPSVVDAVRCAVLVQLAMPAREGTGPEDQRIAYRIGINLGDIVFEDGDIFGDGVNIAARLQQMAEPGGICVSRTVVNHVKGKVNSKFEDLGEKSVKNIVQPVQVYHVLMEPEAAGTGTRLGRRRHWPSLVAAAAGVVIAVAAGTIWWRTEIPLIEPASVEQMAFPLPDKPSLAVLPFNNLSGDPDQDRLSDGTTDNLITMLSKVPELFVVARNSTFTYKGKAVKVQNVAEELGVRYVLEGSFQREGNQVRINVQLVDALSGQHVWVERYDRTIDDIFALQDDIALNVAVALRGVLTQGETAKIGAPTRSLEAWNLSLLAESYAQQWTKEGKSKARELWTKAVKLDPDFASAWTRIGWQHWADIRFDWTSSPESSLELAFEAAERALSIDPNSADAYSLLEGLALIEGRHDDALAYGQKSISLNTNNAGNLASHAIAQYFAGQPEAAERSVKRAMRLNPAYPFWYLLPLEEAYRLTGRYDEAIETIQEELRRLDMFFTRTRLALYYAQSGKDDLARVEIDRVLQAKPDMNLQYWANAQYFKDPAQNRRDMADLRRVGLPE